MENELASRAKVCVCAFVPKCVCACVCVRVRTCVCIYVCMSPIIENKISIKIVMD